jgi:hypothetical protein
MATKCVHNTAAFLSFPVIPLKESWYIFTVLQCVPKSLKNVVLSSVQHYSEA